MDENIRYEEQLRDRITQLRIKKNVSEHRMSLDLGKSGSYIRSITSGAALPSVRELFNIICYFDLTPAAFFDGMSVISSKRTEVQEKLLALSDDELEKLSQFIDWISRSES